jgi:beta-aspartyl-peptidase (threonine type)
MQPSLIVHGGAWPIPDDAVETCRAGCRRALEAGWEVLSSGGAAIDAVEAAIVVLEDDPVFDAGTGSHLNRDGYIELDAIIMEGARLDAGAIAAVRRVRNPIRLARRVLENSPHVMLVGSGAEQYAEESGIPLIDPAPLVVDRERQLWRATRPQTPAPQVARGTVGAIARDARGSLVAGTSTGGTAGKHPGRVGDSPLIGCGCYADELYGAASSTGDGEAIMRVVMAKAAVDKMRDGVTAQAAASACLATLRDRGRGTGGIILLDREGNPGAAFTTPRMAYGWITGVGAYNIP